MIEKERFVAIQIENMKYINGMELKMVYAEKNGEAILYGEDTKGVRYPLDVLPLPKEERNDCAEVI